MEKRFNKYQIEWADEKVSLLWDYYSTTLKPEQYFSCHSGQFILKELKSYVRFEGNVLDFGCGPGFLIAHLLQEITNGTVYGLDFSSEAVAITNRKFKEHSLFGSAVQATKLPSPLNTSSMDIIISVEVIEHLNDDQLIAMFKEVYRLLKPGGQLVVTTPNEEDLEANKTMCPECGCIFHRWQHVRTWDERNLKVWLERHNFKPVVVQPFHFQSAKARFTTKCFALGKKLLGKNSSILQPHLFAIAEKHVYPVCPAHQHRR